ncbi:MAG: LysM peptidoglycan-binding domain-containing protein [Rhabdochlamydiaceae bacterium]
MKINRLYLPIVILSLSFMFSHIEASVVDELRIEMGELKHLVSNYQVDLQLMEERLAKQESGIDNLIEKKKDPCFESRITMIEQKQVFLSKEIEKIAGHFQKLNEVLKQCTEKLTQLDRSFQQQDQRILEVAKLKEILHSIAKPEEEMKHEFYKVVAGDNLDKIAKKTGFSIEAVKKINSLSSDKIYVGQKLKLPKKDE